MTMGTMRPAARKLTLPSGAFVVTRKSTRYVLVRATNNPKFAKVEFGSGSLATIRARRKRARHLLRVECAVFDMTTGDMVAPALWK